MEGLFGIFFILVASIFFAYYSKIPIVFIFSSLIAFASSSYMFRLHGNGGEGPTYIMFGIIFIAVGLWQMIESYRNYV